MIIPEKIKRLLKDIPYNYVSSFLNVYKEEKQYFLYTKDYCIAYWSDNEDIVFVVEPNKKTRLGYVRHEWIITFTRLEDFQKWYLENFFANNL